MRNYSLRRLSDQPILKTTDLKPAMEGFEVLGAFNPAACRVGDQVLLLLRVAEAPRPEKGWLHVPVVVHTDGVPRLTVKTFREPREPYDPRVVTIDGKVYLTSLSHLRLARSHDGIHFIPDDKPFLFPTRADEAFGVEDARITFLEGKYWITYTAVSERGPGVGLAQTHDFTDVNRIGMVLPPPNKDACLFPDRINDKYLMLHRPMVHEIGKPSIWLSESPDGIHWGQHRYVFGPSDKNWEYQKIGAGPEPILTDEGWLVCYHGTSQTTEYALALALLDGDSPSRIIGRSAVPLLTPELAWEREGFFPNVVFSNGWIQWPDNRIWVYYGAADYGVGLAELTSG
ncbi:glycoside hydrolase family 130 protein [Nibrella viscosa]|uniref:Glycoside hydrolase family 130 protein n=1 Tax=Nibrella viscosa TaxID=1084524 RepID=A0ABP8KDT7_9BACT